MCCETDASTVVAAVSTAVISYESLPGGTYDVHNSSSSGRGGVEGLTSTALFQLLGALGWREGVLRGVGR